MRDESKYRQQLEHIDKKYEQEKRDKIIGKCFSLKEKNDTQNYGYARVESFRESDFKPVGTVIGIYGKGKNKILNIEFNGWIYEDRIENGKQISHAKFNFYLKRVQSMIKFKK